MSAAARSRRPGRADERSARLGHLEPARGSRRHAARTSRRLPLPVRGVPGARGRDVNDGFIASSIRVRRLDRPTRTTRSRRRATSRSTTTGAVVSVNTSAWAADRGRGRGHHLRRRHAAAERRAGPSRPARTRSTCRSSTRATRSSTRPPSSTASTSCDRGRRLRRRRPGDEAPPRRSRSVSAVNAATTRRRRSAAPRATRPATASAVTVNVYAGGAAARRAGADAGRDAQRRPPGRTPRRPAAGHLHGAGRAGRHRRQHAASARRRPSRPPRRRSWRRQSRPGPRAPQERRGGAGCPARSASRPGAASSARLGANESIPLGSTVDATKGKVRITSAAGRRRRDAERALLPGRVRDHADRSGSKPITQLALSPKLSCTSKRQEGVAVGEEEEGPAPVGRRQGPLPHQGPARRGDRPRHEVADRRTRCNRTLVRVKRGTVTVRDFAKQKTVLVKKGRSYVARPRRSSAKPDQARACARLPAR